MASSRLGGSRRSVRTWLATLHTVRRSLELVVTATPVPETVSESVLVARYYGRRHQLALRASPGVWKASPATPYGLSDAAVVLASSALVAGITVMSVSMPSPSTADWLLFTASGPNTNASGADVSRMWRSCLLYAARRVLSARPATAIIAFGLPHFAIGLARGLTKMLNAVAFCGVCLATPTSRGGARNKFKPFKLKTVEARSDLGPTSCEATLVVSSFATCPYAMRFPHINDLRRLQPQGCRCLTRASDETRSSPLASPAG